MLVFSSTEDGDELAVSAPVAFMSDAAGLSMCSAVTEEGRRTPDDDNEVDDDDDDDRPSFSSPLDSSGCSSTGGSRTLSVSSAAVGDG